MPSCPLFSCYSKTCGLLPHKAPTTPILFPLTIIIDLSSLCHIMNHINQSHVIRLWGDVMWLPLVANRHLWWNNYGDYASWCICVDLLTFCHEWLSHLGCICGCVGVCVHPACAQECALCIYCKTNACGECVTTGHKQCLHNCCCSACVCVLSNDTTVCVTVVSTEHLLSHWAPVLIKVIVRTQHTERSAWEQPQTLRW